MGAVAVALIAVIGSFVTSGLVLWGQLHQSKATAEAEADAVLRKFSAPLLTAAFELQARLYNILRLDFLPKYYVDGTDWQKTYALENTLFVIGQFFCWREILRREIRYLDYTSSEQTRAVATCLAEIMDRFNRNDPELGQPFLIFRGEQRAIGQRMMVAGIDGGVDCLGYADFIEKRDPEFRRWFDRVTADLTAIVHEPNKRLLEAQHALIDLIEHLDPDALHHPEGELERA